MCRKPACGPLKQTQTEVGAGARAAQCVTSGSLGDANQLNALLWPRELSALETSPVRGAAAAAANHAAGPKQ